MLTPDNGFKITIVTGNYGGQNVNNWGKGNVCLRFHGKRGEKSAVYTYSGSYFARGSTRKFTIRTFFTSEKIEELEVWIKETHNDPNLHWFVDMVKCTEYPTKTKTIFPMRCWITMNHQRFRANDSLLPQDDPNAQQRRETILMDSQFHKFTYSAGGMPTMTNVKLPSEEFSRKYFGDVFIKAGASNAVKGALISMVTSRWKSIEDLKNVYNVPISDFPKPKIVSKYMDVLKGEPAKFDQQELDRIFAAQRLTGTNPVMIERVRNLSKLKEIMKIQPLNSDTAENLEDLLEPLLGGYTLQKAIEENKLFMVDYTHVLHNIECKTNMISAPIALFFVATVAVDGEDTVDEKQQLMPIAIQLFKSHHKFSGVDNPIFLPTDESYTWLLAKMWFNLADASYHESVSHLGFTHLLMETVYLGLRQTVSLSHPLYRLMAPHFLYVMNVNAFEGTDGCQPWCFDVEGNIENDIKNRGVEDLPNYTFRDDALKLRGIIKTYVSTKVDSTYGDNEGKLHEDYEIQAWGEILYKPTKNGGCGMKGLAFEERLSKDDSEENIYFKYKEELIDTITTVIHTSSVAHAAVNFLQYEQYGFPLNYPALLYGDPPRSKPTSEIDARTAKDILQALPTKKQTLGTMDITQILSQKSTYDKYLRNELGHFPVQYQFTSDGNTPEIVTDFQQSLTQLAKAIQERNQDEEDPYDILDPTHIPNSISI